MKRFRALLVTVLGLSLCGCPPLPGDTRYFLVSEREVFHGDSYILPLSDPADIAHAEALIQDPESGAPIVLAKIARGAGNGAYINRDLAGSGEAWSWHIAEFLGFVDFSIEVLDGWPTYVEENYDDYVHSSSGQIGFWSYTISREVLPCELDSSCP